MGPNIRGERSAASAGNTGIHFSFVSFDFNLLSTRWRGDDQVHVAEPRGIYRERKGWGDQDSVRVKYDEHQELDLPEDRYRNRGYQPPFDQLPWKDEDANDNA
jgi:hypothetical protein